MLFEQNEIDKAAFVHMVSVEVTELEEKSCPYYWGHLHTVLHVEKRTVRQNGEIQFSIILSFCLNNNMKIVWMFVYGTA